MQKRSLTNREIYQRRLEQKKCGVCVCASPMPEAQGSKKTCDRCLANVRHHGNRTRAQRRLQGLCSHCGAPAAPHRKMCAACLELAKTRYQDRKQSGACTRCGAAPATMKAMCAGCSEKSKRKLRDWRDRLMVEVMNAYGGCVCRCCGETRVAFLTLDHIGGGGNRHRAAMKEERNTDIYTWVKKRRFPPGFQVLCMNCNWARGKYGECPHQAEAPKPFTFIA